LSEDNLAVATHGRRDNGAGVRAVRVGHPAKNLWAQLFARLQQRVSAQVQRAWRAGTLGWVYQEAIYGAPDPRTFWWSSWGLSVTACYHRWKIRLL